MSKKRVKIGEKPPHPLYMPKELVDDGFIGEVIIFPNAVTATIVRPGTALKDAIRSLERIVDDLKHREAMGMELDDEKGDDEKPEEKKENHSEKVDE